MVGYSAFPIQDEYVLLTHFPKSNELNFQILKPLGKWTWVASCLSVALFALTFSLFYTKHVSALGRSTKHPTRLSYGNLVLKILMQLQQPTSIYEVSVSFPSTVGAPRYNGRRFSCIKPGKVGLNLEAGKAIKRLIESVSFFGNRSIEAESSVIQYYGGVFSVNMYTYRVGQKDLHHFLPHSVCISCF